MRHFYKTKTTQIFDTNQKHQFYSLSFEDDLIVVDCLQFMV